MRVLVVGSGAREHALAWRLRHDGHDVLAAPGNPGIARIAPCHPLPLDDIPGLVAFARAQRVELTVVGPEAPLAAGLVDALEAAGLLAFGPRSAAARLESSKVFAKELMAERGVPTARFAVVDDVEDALDAARGFGFPCVLKADGLAAGKGVAIVSDEPSAARFAEACLIEHRFGAAGERLVIEERLSGEEASLFFLCDGRALRRFLPARDYKRLGDGDQGPNTGGMGAHAPAALDDDLARRVEDTITRPVVDSLAARGTPFRGLLYIGLMITREGPRVLEFNVRFGDPETQVLLPLVEGDLGGLMAECAKGALAGQLAWKAAAAVGVVLAAPGYPEAPALGGMVHGLEAWPDSEEEDRESLWCFHAGTACSDGGYVASGGRVVTVVARETDLAAARRLAYRGMQRLALEGGQVRRDIAAEADVVSPSA